MTGRTGSGAGSAFPIRTWNISGNTGQGKARLPRFWRRDIRNTSCVFPLRRKWSCQRQKPAARGSALWISKAQREHGSGNVRSFWAYAARVNGEHAKKAGKAIAAYAQEMGADVIVFEHLGIHGRIHGSKKQRLALWRKQDIQEVCTRQAHRAGIHISRICAWNTSALAFDGSGKVERDGKNHSLCRFTGGKQYNCDLSASYNIGARYLIRETIKPLPETARSYVEAKVPSLKRRISCVYADLIKLMEVMREAAA